MYALARFWPGLVVPPAPQLGAARPPFPLRLNADFTNFRFQNVLQTSLMEPLIAEPLAVPAQADLDRRYGPLFGRAILELWDVGGQDIWQQVNPDEEEVASDAMVL